MYPYRQLRSLLANLTLATLLVSGCSGFVDAAQPNISAELWEPLDASHTVGQTFVARHAGLDGIAVLLRPDGILTGGVVTLHVRAGPESAEDIAAVPVPAAQITRAESYRFSFPPIPDSDGARYYFFLEAEELVGGALKVAHAPEAAYLDGAAYRNHTPLDRQSIFQLHYATVYIVIDLVSGVVQGAGLLFVMLSVFFLPGWALLVYVLPNRPLAWPARLGLAGGLGLCIYPLILLWSRVLGLQLGALAVWLPVSLAIIALAWRYRSAIHVRPASVRAHTGAWLRSDAFAPDFILAWVALMAFGVRMFVIRGIDVPLWGDSVQHAAIAQLITDQGGLFDSWLPYTPFHTLTVHFGFHSDIAAVNWLAGGAIARNTVVVGQFVNFMAVLALVPLANRLLQSRWAGVGVLLGAGLLSPMPMEYVNWGRYSQLTGQAVLPVAAWLTWELIETREKTWRVLPLTGFALAGMFLSYYRMPHYYAAFVVALLLAYGLSPQNASWRVWGRWGARLIAAGALVLLLSAPWLANIAGGNLAASIEAGVSRETPLAQVLQEYEALQHIATYVPYGILFLAGGGLALGMIRRQRAVVAIGLWSLGLVSLMATQLIRLPGSNYMTSFAIMIALYIPAGLLSGYLVDSVMDTLYRHKKRGVRLLAAAGLLAVAVWSAKDRIGVINPAYRIVAPADLAAMDWIRSNVPADARFLVDGFLIYEGRSVVGSDAGWWIPLLAGRQNTMPPQYALFNEKPNEPGYAQTVTNLVARLRQVGVTSPEGMRILCEHGITHVYIGQGQGRVALSPPEPMLSTADLEASPRFAPLYRQDKVRVYAFDESICK